MADLAGDKQRLMQKLGGRPGGVRRAPAVKPKDANQGKKRGCGCKRNKKK